MYLQTPTNYYVNVDKIEYICIEETVIGTIWEIYIYFSNANIRYQSYDNIREAKEGIDDLVKIIKKIKEVSK